MNTIRAKELTRAAEDYVAAVDRKAELEIGRITVTRKLAYAWKECKELPPHAVNSIDAAHAKVAGLGEQHGRIVHQYWEACEVEAVARRLLNAAIARMKEER